MTQVRLYGPIVGNGSFCRVAAGLRTALSELSLLAGFVPIDAYDEEAPYGGGTAPVGFFIGPMGQAGIMQTRGMHRERLVLLPPNSSFVPPALLRFLEQGATGLVSPSRWGAEVLRRLTPLPVEVAPHGVDAGFRRGAPEQEQQLDEAYERRGHFNMLHLASTVAERKGTRELLRAWARCIMGGNFGKRSLLFIAADGPPDSFHDLLREEGISPSFDGIVWLPRLNSDVKKMALLMQSMHLVACPSRGEGFGMIPLEARACGVPVLVTGSCTGHAEHCPPPDEAQRCGVVDVPVGPVAPIDEAPGALAPSLDVDDLQVRLQLAYEQWPQLSASARASAEDVQARWSWKTVTAAWWRWRTSSLDRRAPPT